MEMHREPRRRRAPGRMGVVALLAGSLLAPAGQPRGAAPAPEDLRVRIIEPDADTAIAGTVTISADVEAAGPPVKGVRFRVDGASVGDEVTTSPYAIAWNSLGASNGRHVLTALVRTAEGLRATSPPISIVVANDSPQDTTPPTVSMISPRNGSTVSGDIEVSAEASDNMSVAGVQFILDGKPLGEEITTPPFHVAWDTRTTHRGRHAIAALARDASSNVSTSVAVTVTVGEGSSHAPGSAREAEPSVARADVGH